MNEEEFHDRWAREIDPSQLLVEESFEACTAPETRQIMEWLGSVHGKKILDLGCGAGEAAVYFAIKGARVTAADLSAGMLNVAQALASRRHVAINTRQCLSHRTGLPDQEFDIIYAANLLHHVDKRQTLAEVSRLLKPGGLAVFWDPLRHNPLINIYRLLARRVRTDGEQPLHINDRKIFKQYFPVVTYKCYWLTTLWIFIAFFLKERVNPNQERYWK